MDSDLIPVTERADFEVVREGYDRGQVDQYVDEIIELLKRLIEEAESTYAVRMELDAAQQEISRLRRHLEGRPAVFRTTGRIEQMLRLAEQEAADIVAQARRDCEQAHRDADAIRAQAHDDACAARRDFETALHARRMRERRVDALWQQVVLVDVDSDDDGSGQPTRAPIEGEAASAADQDARSRPAQPAAE